MDHMEFSIALPPFVEFTNAGIEWADMKERLLTHDIHSSDSHQYQHEGLVKAFLINIAAEEVQEIFNMFRLTYDEALKFSQILQCLEDVCVPRLLIIYNRYKFFTCKQTGDNFDYFLRDLLNWSQSCEFGDLKDILLKDCIITGVPDNDIRQLLLETEELDFAKTIKICKAIEKRKAVKNVLVNTDQIIFVDAAVDTENMENCNDDTSVDIENIDKYNVDVSVDTENIEKCNVDASVATENIEKYGDKEQIQKSEKEFSDASTNTMTNEFTIGLTKELITDTAKNAIKSLMRNISMHSEESSSFSESLILSDSTESSDTESVYKTCSNSHVISETRVLRRSERHKKLMENRLNSGSKINKTTDHKESDNTKMALTLKTSSGLNKTVDCNDQVEISSRKKIKESKSDPLINRAAGKKNNMAARSRQKLKLLEKGSKVSKTQCHKEKDSGKALKFSMKSLVHENGLENLEENMSIVQELICSFCGQNFSDKLATLLHVQQTHSNKHFRKLSLKCRVCKAVFLDMASLKKHRLQHKSEKKFKCDVCSTKFCNPSHLKVHMRLHTGERPFICDTCGASYPEASKLKAHTRKHTGEKPYSCTVCGRTFAWTAAYTRHMRTHTGERPYTCEFCGVSFADLTSLQRHIRTHTLEKPYQCDTCSAKFTDPSALKLHNRIHNGERPYVCGTCGTAFIRSQHLKEHTKLHTGEKPFSCETCGAKFAEASKLKSHCRKHTGEKPYLCKVCGTKFAWTAAFTRHMRTHTLEKPYICDFCGSHFADHSTLTRHRRTHTGERPYPCKICDTHFADNSSLHRHMRIHTGEKSYTCEVCGSSFAVKSYLVRHMRTHTGEKPYVCEICESKFTDSSKLNRHKKMHFKTQVKQGNVETQQYVQLQPMQQFPSNELPVNSLPDDKQGKPMVVHNIQQTVLQSSSILQLKNATIKPVALPESTGHRP